MAWYDDSLQGLTEAVITAISDIIVGLDEYEEAEVIQGRPQFRDTDLPLVKPVITVEPSTISHVAANFGDLLEAGREGMTVLAQFVVSVFTSRGARNSPRSSSGGINTANRILGLLMNDINTSVNYIPDCVQVWRLNEVPSAANYGLAEYDEERDLYEAQGILFVESEIWRRTH